MASLLIRHVIKNKRSIGSNEFKDNHTEKRRKTDNQTPVLDVSEPSTAELASAVKTEVILIDSDKDRLALPII